MYRQLACFSICTLSLVIVACGGNSDSESPAEQAASKLQDCGLISDGRVGRLESSCVADCIDEASCRELEELVCDFGSSGTLDACLSDCDEEDTFVCDDGEDLPASWKCDGEEDCSDGSDEEGCGTSNEFECGSGEKIPIYWECDGEADCFDSSDEAGCAEIICN